MILITGSGKYQPQVSHPVSSGEESGVKLAAMKPVKQTVTYDSSTGKMYEELGSSGSSGEVIMGHNHVTCHAARGCGGTRESGPILPQLPALVLGGQLGVRHGDADPGPVHGLHLLQPQLRGPLR